MPKPRVDNKTLLDGAEIAPEAFDRGRDAVHSLPVVGLTGDASRACMITYVKGASCEIAIPEGGSVRFERGRPVMVTNKKIIDRCRLTAGFVVSPCQT